MRKLRMLALGAAMVLASMAARAQLQIDITRGVTDPVPVAVGRGPVGSAARSPRFHSWNFLNSRNSWYSASEMPPGPGSGWSLAGCWPGIRRDCC